MYWTEKNAVPSLSWMEGMQQYMSGLCDKYTVCAQKTDIFYYIYEDLDYFWKIAVHSENAVWTLFFIE